MNQTLKKAKCAWIGMHDYEKKVRKVSFCTTIQEVMFDVFDWETFSEPSAS